MEMEKENLDEILENHVKWLCGDDGKRADLRGADLRGANFRGVDLRGADLYEANLREANLRGANLREAKLRRADLYDADLRGANLRGADLYEANLREVDLRRADLYDADLRGAKLRGANVRGANLEDAFLEGGKLPIGIYQIVGAGRCNRCTTYDSINDRVICGCWNDDEGNHLDSFTRRVEEIYGSNGAKPNLEFYQEYMAAISFFKAMKELGYDKRK